MGQIKISIIIVTYNSREYIDNCLTTIYKNSDIETSEFEIIIVDNSNKEEHDLLRDHIKPYSEGNVIMIHNEKNGGYGQGNNLGIQYCKGDIIAIMNPDIITTQPLFKKTITYFQNNERLGLLAYKQLGASDLSYYIRQEFYTPLLTNNLLKIYNKLNIFNKKKMFISGAYFFTTKKAFEDVGYFDENIFMYCEESDITQRFLRKNYDIIYDSSISYIHDIAEREEMSLNGFKALITSSIYYLRKYNFNEIAYLKKMRFELKMKKNIFKLMGRSDRSSIISEHIRLIDDAILNLK